MNEQEKKDYVEFRKSYLKVGVLLSENQTFYEAILQNQEEIKTIIIEGWGY